jgi:trimeric autotransporter adhesin
MKQHHHDHASAHIQQSLTVFILAVCLSAPVFMVCAKSVSASCAVDVHLVLQPSMDWGNGRPITDDASPPDIPWLRLQRALSTAVSYEAASVAATLLESGALLGTSLAYADFDTDGRPDLACGYETEGRGIVTVRAGLVSTNNVVPFESRAFAFMTPVVPELMEAGDFDADGLDDLVLTQRGGNALYFLLGNGRGQFVSIRERVLEGSVSHLAAGDLDCRDGLVDLAIGIETAQGPRVAIIGGQRGAVFAPVELVPVPGVVRALGLGNVNAGPGVDVAALTDRGLAVVAGTDRRTMPNGPRQVALVRAEGGTSLTIEGKEVQAAFTVVDELGRAVTRSAQSHATKARWKPRTSEPLGRGGLVIGATISSLPGGDIVGFAPGDHRLTIMLGRGEASARIDLPARIAAVLPLRLNGDALDDLVVLYRNGAAPDVLLTVPQNTYVVTTTNTNGPGSLAVSISSANASPGPDAVHFAISGVAPFTIDWTSVNVPVTEALTIDATSQSGYAGSPLVEMRANMLGTGLRVTGGASVIRGLAINRFSFAIGLESNGGNVVEGNYLGMGVDGVTPQGNAGFGILVESNANTIGGTTASARNVISGNGNSGVKLGFGTSGNVVSGNYIGTNAAGTAARPNLWNGIDAEGIGNTIGGTAPGTGNVISGNTRSGIEIASTGPSTVQGNIVGLDANGAGAIGNGYVGVFAHGSGHLIGGSTSSARNVLSVNRYGILANANDTIIQGNYIGTDATGILDRGNVFDGIEVGGTFCSILENLISGNDRYGIGTSIAPANGLIRANRIGTDATGTAPIPNASIGVRIDGTLNTVEENTIAFNAFAGVVVYSDIIPQSNGIHRNSIFSNSSIAIDLVFVDANDPRDADTGSNSGQNHPVLHSAVVGPTSITVTGILTSAPNETFTIEFFSSPGCPSTGRGDGKTYLGVTSVSTNAVGRADFAVELPLVTTGEVISATATDSQDNTSELSPCREVTPTTPAPRRDAIGVYIPSTAAWFLRNTATPGNADVVFGYGASGMMMPLAGDWDGTLTDTAGIYDPSSSAFFLRNSNTGGNGDSVFVFGGPGSGSRPVSGDWDGDGIDTIGLYQPATGAFFLRNAHAPGPADVTFAFGAAGGMVAIAGDWDGDGADSVGLYVPSTGAFFLTNSNTSGPADLVFFFGAPGGMPVAGDWDGDGADTVGVYYSENGTWFLTNRHEPGPADVTVGYGPAGARPVTGNWDGL